ncbi:MAG TPA: PPOX class F420-dependent oxidoreductase [Acidimicrobiales bacterium]|nr:PPOX class F420-dependent oxidoreductase [Acidimicrobiales bacterium]
MSEWPQRGLHLPAFERRGFPRPFPEVVVSFMNLFDDAGSLRESPTTVHGRARAKASRFSVGHMDLDQARQFVRQHHRAVLATRRVDGSLQLSPVSASVDASGRLVVSSRETAFKTKNVRRDPSVSICVFTDGFYGPWVQIDGTAEVIPLPEAMDWLVEYYRSISGEHPDWDDYRAAMEREQRVLFAVTILRAGPDRHG